MVMADTKLIDWGDGSGEKITVTASSFVGNKGLQIQSPENVKVTPRSKTIVLKSKTDPTKVARINVTQEKAVYTYDFTLTASVPIIAAKGGSSIISAQLKTYRNGILIETKAVTPVLSGTGTGFSISGTTVSASNRTTVVGAERSITVTGKFSGTFDGQEVTATVVVKQEANSATSITYGTPVVSLSVSDIPASGGTISSGIVTYYQTRVQNYTSGSTSTLTPLTSGGVVFYSTAVTASSLGTTVKSRTKIGTLTAVVVMNGKSGSNAADVYQQSNAVVSAVKTVDISLASGAGSSSSNPIPASGGRIQYNATGNTRTTYTSGSYKDEGFTPTISGSAEGFTVDQPSASAWYITAANRGTVVGDIRSVVVTASATGATSKSVTVYQQANSVESVEIRSWQNREPIVSASASGIYNTWYDAYATYTSTTRSQIQGAYSGWSTSVPDWIVLKAVPNTAANAVAVNILNRGTVVGAARSGTLSFTYGGKTDSITITQAENRIERYNYGAWSIAISANPTTIAYGGGTSTISASCTRSKTPVYSSGATGSTGSESVTPTLSGSATGFTLSGTTVTASANSWASTRSITVTASYSGATSKSVTITQSAAPASISLNKTAIAFPQRASSNIVQVTCNSDWGTNSNVEFAVPETLQIKYNPSTDMVEIVDQPSQIIKKVQESDDYVLALVRIGAHQSAANYGVTKTISRENIRDLKNSSGFKNRNQMFLLSKQQDKSFHRIVARQWFRNGDATSQITAGGSYGRHNRGDVSQASLFAASILISKPNQKLGLRGCELSIPRLHVAFDDLGAVYSCNSVNWNKDTGRVTLEVSAMPMNSTKAQPRLAFVASTSNNGPIGYILFKKKSTTEYLDIRGWEEISNFALARVLSDSSYMERFLSNDRFEVVVKFQYGDV